MNYLAHIFLSGQSSSVQVGNFIGDFVKGRAYSAFSPKIARGIKLHRAIDSYTDSHELVLEAMSLLRPSFGRYSGIILDMYFDYFLAVHFKQFSRGRSLKSFAFRFNIAVLFYYRILPRKVQGFIFHFVFTNRLCCYSSMEGLKSSLEIMACHKVPALNPAKVIEFLQENEQKLEVIFMAFFYDLLAYVQNHKYYSGM